MLRTHIQVNTHYYTKLEVFFSAYFVTKTTEFQQVDKGPYSWVIPNTMSAL